MNARQLLNKSAKKNMIRWNEKDFIKTYPKLYKTIIEAIEDGIKGFYCVKTANNESKCEHQCQSCIDWVEEADELKLKTGSYEKTKK